MNPSDYQQAWKLISSWGDDESREAELTAVQASPRRPYVVIAMMRIAAMLSLATVSDGLITRLRQSPDAEMEEAILRTTDQILNGFKPDAEMTAQLLSIVDAFAEREAANTDAARKAIVPAAPTQIRPTSGTVRTIRIDEAPIFARVRVVKLGSLDTLRSDLALLGETVITWTEMQRSNDIFAEVEIRGILRPENEVAWTIGELSWLSGDAEVEIIEPPRYAGQPEDLIALAQPVKGPQNPGSRDGWPPLIWQSDPLHSALVPLQSSLPCVDTLLCALSVAPPTFDVVPWLLAGLKARYAQVLREADSWPERSYYWRYQDGPPEDCWLT